MRSVSCRIYSTENEDGSYTVGLQSDSRGESASSVLALLTKSAGYTLNDNFEKQSPEEHYSHQEPEKESSQFQQQPTLESRGLLGPHLEILQLVEIFLKLKGELASRFHAVVADNYDLIRSVYMTLINKIGSIHSFTLTGIKILRKILEFAVTVLGQWQVNAPSIDFNAENEETNPMASFHLTKNGNYFRNQ